MADGALLLYTELGPRFTDAELDDWFETGYSPSPETVKGVQSVLRYKAIDDQKPSVLTLYDLESPSVVKSDAYISFRAPNAKRDAELIFRMEFHQRRLYQRISTFAPTPIPPSSLPGKYIVAICVLPEAAAEEEYNRWMDNEHMALMAKVPGYLRGRRYKIVKQEQSKGEAPEKGPLTYLALHELEIKPDANNSELIFATGTPGFNKAAQSIVDLEFRMFEQYDAL